MDRQKDDFLPLAERPRPSILAAEALALIALAGLWLSSLAAAYLPDGPAQPFLVDLIYYGPFVVLPVALYGLRRGRLSDGLRLNPMPVLPSLLIVFLAVLSVYFASALDSLWALLLDAIGLSEPEVSLSMEGSHGLVLAVLHAAAIPAVCEELLFRGAVFSAFERRGTAVGIWVSAALFGLMHGSLYGLPAYILVGAISAFVVFTLDSLYAGMLYHTVYNATILVLLHLMSSQPELADTSITAAMVASLALDLVMVGLSISLMLTALNLRRRVRGIAAVPPTPGRLTGPERALLALLCLALVASMAGALLLSTGGAA